VRNDNGIDQLGEPVVLGDVVEVGKAALVVVAHVHPTVKHHVLAANAHKHAAAAHVLACTQRYDLHNHCFFKITIHFFFYKRQKQKGACSLLSPSIRRVEHLTDPSVEAVLVGAHKEQLHVGLGVLARLEEDGLVIAAPV